MTDEITKHGPEVDFEREDLAARPIYIFLVGLAVVCLLVYFILRGMYVYLDVRENANQPAPNPLVAVHPDVRKPTTAEIKSGINRSFPEPRLEVNEREQLSDVVAGEERQLASYGWVDQKGGVVHIPIDQAMKMLVERGLPVAPSVHAAKPQVSEKKVAAGQK